MLKEESVWIKRALADIPLSGKHTVLDVGSSTKEFRSCIQPYIDENVFLPLRERNMVVYHMDSKKGDGIDLVYDIEKVTSEEIGMSFDLVICSNVMEHVLNSARLASLLTGLVSDQGFLLVTVPRSYRCHEDPIDTMFRPSVEMLESMFPLLNVISKETVFVRDRERYRKSEFLRYLIPFLRWKVSCLLMRKGIAV